MEVMQYPNHGELKEALMAAMPHTVNGYGVDTMKLQKSREEEEKMLNGEGHKSSVYLDEDGEANKTADMMSCAEIGNVGQLGRLVSAARGGGAMEAEEEVIELEFFDRAIDKLQTHNAYCPKCRSPISKVILRIKRETRPPIDNKLDFDLLGCLACFRIFLPNKTVTTPVESSGRTEEDQQESDNSAGKCFDLLWFIGGTPKAQTSQKQQTAPTPTQQETRASPPEMIDDDDAVVIHEQDVKHELQCFGDVMSSGICAVKPNPEITQENKDGVQNQGGDVRVQIDESPNKAGTGTRTGTRTSTQSQVDPHELEERGSKSVEILKSVVYGGLIESITSLSVVSSAAASGATTLNTVAIGVANLIGGSFVVAHNLLDLKIKSPEEEYHKVLGQRNHFLLHAIVAMLSYLIFGLTPPALYGFTFRQNDDRDLKLLGVAVASFACILLLAIGKAYNSGANTFKQYFLTILQYATAAATASGVAYAVGHLFQKLMDELGWFNSTPTHPTLLLPNINSPNPNSAFF